MGAFRGEAEGKVVGNQGLVEGLERDNKLLQDRIDGLRGGLVGEGGRDLDKRLIAAKWQYGTLKKEYQGKIEQLLKFEMVAKST